ncbi:putative yeast cortical protein KAR9 [Lyophyllum shimeji]|uniref:Yeast cortical protein KAR9 n=1 Tax=Lyophyllum shimeji TaxID=47721 RepID=A0A9P3PSG8_LYOSH|nr:putative yeast cortical protein KAR9 [Lyophyllum shimeji]
MVSISVSPRSSNLSASSQANVPLPPSPSSFSGSSASSSKVSLDQEDEENVTITRPLSKKSGRQRSQDDLRLLAVSTHMTELSYAISDIQTRIFEIQELRHKSQSTGDSTSTTNVIDQSLMSLNEKLESVEKGMKTINEALEPLLQSTSTPTFQPNGDLNENALMLRKHAALQAEWEAVQNESDVLREELKEDKWLTVFRTVTDQADGMMSSLEKAVNRCQEFIWEVHRHGADDPRQSQTSLSAALQRNDKAPQPLTLEVCASLLESFEAKKKHYMPATSKVLSIIDKGVRDRVTKNGETLRRHAESAQRWKNLRERISRTEVEMENVRRILLSWETAPSETGSSTSGTMSTKNGYLATPPSGSRTSKAPSSAGTLSRSISPLRKFARKITGSSRPPPVTPLSVNKNSGNRTPSSEPVQSLRRQRTSLFTSLKGSQPPTPITPDRPVHKYSLSLTPDASPRAARVDNSTIKARPTPPKQPWNSSTKVNPEERAMAIKGTPPKRSPSAAGMYGDAGDIPPVPPLGTPYRRSLSRASMASSRPWSPVTSSISTSQSSQPTYFPVFRPPSRSQTPAAPPRGVTPGLSTTPRSRPKTPSHIPKPSKQFQTTPSRSDNSTDDDGGALQRAVSPTMSVTSSGFGHPRDLPVAL